MNGVVGPDAFGADCAAHAHRQPRLRGRHPSPARRRHVSSDSFYTADRSRGIRTLRIDDELPHQRRDQHVQVLHRHGAEEHFVAHHQGAGQAAPVLEPDQDRPHVRHRAQRPVGHPHRAPVELVQTELYSHPLRNAEQRRPGVDQRRDGQRLVRRILRVRNLDSGPYVSHAGLLPLLRAERAIRPRCSEAVALRRMRRARIVPRVGR